MIKVSISQEWNKNLNCKKRVEFEMIFTGPFEQDSKTYTYPKLRLLIQFVSY